MRRAALPLSPVLSCPVLAAGSWRRSSLRCCPQKKVDTAEGRGIQVQRATGQTTCLFSSLPSQTGTPRHHCSCPRKAAQQQCHHLSTEVSSPQRSWVAQRYYGSAVPFGRAPCSPAGPSMEKAECPEVVWRRVGHLAPTDTSALQDPKGRHLNRS